MTVKTTSVAAALIFAAFAALAASQIKQSEPDPVRRLDYHLPQYQHLTNRGLSILAVSPDGKQFAYCTTGGIYLCSGNPLTAKLVPGTQGTPTQPFFSPDGQWIAYWSEDEGMLKKIPIDGGKPIPLRGVAGPISGAHWSAEDVIVYSRNGGAIMQVSANGKNPKTLFDSPSGLAVYPQILPDRNSVLYTATRVDNAADSKIVVRSLKSGQEKIVWVGSKARYLPSGHLVYKTVDRIVMAVPFDLRTLEVTGKQIPVMQDIWDNGAMQYAISDTGALVYVPDDPGAVLPGQFIPVWVTRDGKEEPLGAGRNRYSYLKVSPEGTRVALTVNAGENRGIWIWDSVRKNMTRLISDPNAGGSLWTLDGRHIVYHSTGDNTSFDIFRKPVNGNGEAEKLASVPQKPYIFYWTKAEKELTLLHIPGTDSEYPPQISPDGKWVAYWTDESGKNEVYVSPFPEVSKGSWVISAGGGTSPLWSPDGREIFYRDKEAVLAVPIETSPVFKPGNARALFWMPDTPSADDGTIPPVWDISPDGKRFLMMKSAQPYGRISMVANWLELIR